MSSSPLPTTWHAGASKEVIEAIPTVTVGGTGGGLTPDDDPRCCICLADYAPGATLRKLPCSHQFHKCVVQVHVLSLEATMLQSRLLPLLQPACYVLVHTDAISRWMLNVVMGIATARRACLDTWLAQKATCPICQAAAAAGGGK
jgi:RING-like zinc finger